MSAKVASSSGGAAQLQPQQFARNADYATIQAALARYGIEPNPGPDSQDQVQGAESEPA